MSVIKLGGAIERNGVTGPFGICAVLMSVALLFLVNAAAVHAAIIGTYVDARALSTTTDGSYTGGYSGTTNIAPNGSGTFNQTYSGAFADGFWEDRPSFGLNNAGALTGTDRNVIEADVAAAETLPAITTTVSGLANDRYDVYVLYWSVPAADWSVRAKLSTAASYVEYDRSGALGTAGTDTTITNSGIELYEAKIGTTGLVTSFSVNVLNSTSSDPTFDRTWYDGVAFVELPEPASLSLFGISGLLLVRRRRV